MLFLRCKWISGILIVAQLETSIMKKALCLFACFMAFQVFSQDSTFVATDISINKLIDGTLLTPSGGKSENLAIIIAGSGPTDRNGNQNFLKSNSLKKLAERLSKNGIATFRYDKRIVKQILYNNIDKNILFDDFITDAVSVIDYFKKEGTYKNIYIIGHSQGSLVGMIAAQGRAAGFISIAGAGQSIDEVITYQVEKTAPMFTEDTKRVFGIMKTGETTTDFPIALSSIFNIELQPFMMSWMKYKPQEEIKKLDIPILLINGTKDLQVTVDEAQLLKDASEQATLKIIEKMNHIMFIIEGDDLENSKSYNESFRKLPNELIESITNFIKQ